MAKNISLLRSIQRFVILGYICQSASLVGNYFEIEKYFIFIFNFRALRLSGREIGLIR